MIGGFHESGVPFADELSYCEPVEDSPPVFLVVSPLCATSDGSMLGKRGVSLDIYNFVGTYGVLLCSVRK